MQQSTTDSIGSDGAVVTGVPRTTTTLAVLVERPGGYGSAYVPVVVNGAAEAAPLRWSLWMLLLLSVTLLSAFY